MAGKKLRYPILNVWRLIKKVISFHFWTYNTEELLDTSGYEKTEWGSFLSHLIHENIRAKYIMSKWVINHVIFMFFWYI